MSHVRVVSIRGTSRISDVERLYHVEDCDSGVILARVTRGKKERQREREEGWQGGGERDVSRVIKP